MTDTVRIGVLGAGFIGDKHINACSHVKGAKVVGVADKRIELAEKLAKPVAAASYSSLEEMLDKASLDVLDVGLPTTLHKDAVLKGLDAGLDILVEKPFATNTDDIDIMMDAVKKSGKRLMVAHVCRFKQEYIFAKEMIDSADFGKVLYFGAWRESETPSWSWNNWLFDRKLSGGTVLDFSIHDIDLANWYLGNPVHFYAQEVSRGGAKGPSHVISNISFENGAASTIEAGQVMPVSYPFTTGFRLVFENGTIESEVRDPEYKFINIFTDESVKKLSFDELQPIPGDNPYAAEIQHFVDCLKSGKDFKISMEEARLAVSSVMELRKSLDSKQSRSF